MTKAQRFIELFVKSGRVRVDAQGRVWRIATARGGGRGRPAKVTPIEPKRLEQLSGKYLRVAATMDGERVVVPAHRLVYTVFHGPIPPGMVVNHIDARKFNNHPDNLEAVTHSGNMRHARELGRSGKVTLTRRQVDEMREMYAAGGFTQTALAGRFQVTPGQVSRVLRGEAWDGHPLEDACAGVAIANRCVLTPDVVEAARAKYAAGATCASLAREFGVGDSTLRAAVLGKTWGPPNVKSDPLAARYRRRSSTPRQEATVHWLRAQGKTQAAIAQDVGAGQAWVSLVLANKSGRRGETPRNTPEFIENARKGLLPD